MSQIGDIFLCKYDLNSVFVLGDLLGKKKKKILSSQVKCFLGNAAVERCELVQTCGRRIPVAVVASGCLYPVCTRPRVAVYVLARHGAGSSRCPRQRGRAARRSPAARLLPPRSARQPVFPEQLTGVVSQRRSAPLEQISQIFPFKKPTCSQILSQGQMLRNSQNRLTSCVLPLP